MIYAGTSFGLGSIIGPLVGNLIGGVFFNSLLLKYFLTFEILCLGFGLSLAYALHKYGKSAEPEPEEVLAAVEETEVAARTQTQPQLPVRSVKPKTPYEIWLDKHL